MTVSPPPYSPSGHLPPPPGLPPLNSYPPPGPPPPPAKKSNTGLVIGLVVALVAVGVLGAGAAGWYFLLGGDQVVAEAGEEEPKYPQSYALTVDPVPDGQVFPTERVDDPCALMDTERFTSMMPVTDSQPVGDGYADADVQACTLELGNGEKYAAKGDTGGAALVFQVFADAGEAAGAFDNDSSFWTDASGQQLTVEGFEVDHYAVGYEDEDWSRSVRLGVVNGNMTATIDFRLEDLNDEVDGPGGDIAPDVPLETMAALCVDTLNGVMASLAK